MNKFIEKEIIYENGFSKESDICDWIMEGKGVVSFPKKSMRLESLLPREAGQDGNIVFWCPETFSDKISISWDFQPLNEPGLAILFFAALGRNGEDILTGNLENRKGPYDQYHHGDLNALHVSYFRRNIGEHEFQICNLRKSHGFHLVAQGADPIPTVGFIKTPYRLKLIKYQEQVSFSISYNDETVSVFTWCDDESKYGPILGKGKIGFRQMTPLIAEYRNLVVRRVEQAP